jgi:hypothetical protein
MRWLRIADITASNRKDWKTEAWKIGIGRPVMNQKGMERRCHSLVSSH